MRTSFLDSSAIVKIYAKEPGSQQVRALLRSTTSAAPTVTLVVCDLALAEVSSALARKEREGTISNHQATKYFTRMRDHFLGVERPYLVILASSIMADASSLTRQYAVRGMDAVQLAAAIAAKHMAPPGTDFSFVCADDRLCRAAHAENIQAINPTTKVPASGS